MLKFVPFVAGGKLGAWGSTSKDSGDNPNKLSTRTDDGGDEDFYGSLLRIAGNKRLLDSSPNRVTSALEASSEVLPDAASRAAAHDAALTRCLKKRRGDVDAVVEYLPAAAYSLPEPFFCDTCNEAVTCLDRQEHEVATLHLFNRARALGLPTMRRIQLADGNRGFQMLAKMGFDELTGGLGAERQGRLEPVATTFKMGTRGLGHVSEKAKSVSAPPASPPLPLSAEAGGRLMRRVTHFPSQHGPALVPVEGGELSQAKRCQDALDGHRNGAQHPGGGGGGRGKRRHRRALEERLKAKKEAAIRRELSGALPEGYERYFLS